MDRFVPRRAARTSARWLWLAMLLAPPVAAQQGKEPSAGEEPIVRPAPPAGETSEADAQVRRRLLRARGGGALRAETRFADGHWEYRRDGERAWIALPAGLVASSRLESEALDELHARRAALVHATPAQLAELADWALDQGLYDECLAQLDDVLRQDPDQPQALELLHRHDLPFGLPSHGDGGADDLLQFAAAAPPALRELAVAHMAYLDNQPELRAALLGHLSGRTAAERAMAALALRRLCAADPASPAELQALLLRAARDVAPEVRHAAALALRDAHAEGLVLPLVDALGSSSAAIRTNAAEALGLMNYSAAVPALVDRLVTLPASGGGGGGFSGPRSNVFVGTQIAFVQGFKVQVAQNAAIGQPQVGTLQEGSSLDVSVMGASGPSYSAESAALRGALERLTGSKPGNSVAAWASWWAGHKSAWDAPPPSTRDA